ncbi:MAG: InlB B-repeat-containing protein [Muribaculaceae bacterium]|nr:InlB B-repeat-containing protein [Muribaculaceae bacterium]
MTEKQFHALIEAQDPEKKAAAWRVFENKSKIKEQKTMAKSKKRTRRKVIAFFVALVLIAGVVLAGYCARVDGKWFANGKPTTWRWGGIVTETGDEPAAKQDDVQAYKNVETPATVAANSNVTSDNGEPADETTLTFQCDIYPFTVVTRYESRSSYPYYTSDSNHTITSASTKVYLISDWDSAAEEYTYLVDIYCGDHLSPAYCSINYSNGYYADSKANVVVEVQFHHEHSYSWVITTEATTEYEGTESYKCSVCGDVSDTRTLPKLREPVELPEDPVKEGYTFTGWFFDENCTEAYDGRPIYEDTVLYAGWRLNTYTVTFDSAGGSDVPAQTVDWNTAASLTTPERVGYTFVGWYLSDGTKYEAQLITDNVTLTARWQIIKCTVNFYVDGTLYTSLSVDFGTPLIQAAVLAGLYKQNIIAYAFLNGADVSDELAEVRVTDDMTVSASEPTTQDKVDGFWERNWLYVASAGVCVVAAALLAWVIFGGRPRKR